MTPNLSLNDVAFVGVVGAAGDQTYTPTYASSDWLIYPTVGGSYWHVTDEANSEIDFKSMRNPAADRGISYDLGSTLSDEKWLMRFQLDIDELNDPSGNGIYESFSLNAVDSSVPDNTGNTAISMSIQLSSSEKYFFATWGVNTGVHINQTEIGSDMLATGTWYIELIRLTTTSFSLRVTDQSDYTGGNVETITGVSASIVDLQYFTSKSSAGAEIANYILGSFKNIVIYDNVTAIP